MPSPLSSSMTMKRIHREIADAKKEDLGPITLAPTQDGLYHWKATIPGPQGSPYEGGVFNVDIQLATDYPFSAPKVTFATRIYHMNISDKGSICIDILKQNWSPALSLFKVMLSLSSLLTDPNPHDPLVPSIATEYIRNRAQHDRTAKRWTELYARPPPPPPPPQPASSATSVTGSSSRRAKGKEKAQTPQTASSNRSGGTAAGSSGSSVAGREAQSRSITIEEVSTQTPAPPRQSGRKRRREPDTIDVDLAEEGRTRSRRRVLPGYSLQSSGEVIVIDD
ncbi:ubiquitin-conjugating enzyme/RWD-like protein [Boletus edulis]|nr:ubiquitin-conjugating enzyme/RWD-like protein [Boletus edulis]